MPREHVYGPYKHGKRWRLEIVVSAGGSRQKQYESFATESEAIKFRKAIEREIEQSKDSEAFLDKALYFQERAEHYFAEAERASGRRMTVRQALEQYIVYQRDVKGNKDSTLAASRLNIRALIPDLDVTLVSITERKAKSLYHARTKQVAVDTHQGNLRQVKTFMRWCVSKGWIRRDPFAKVEPHGQKKTGKEQLRVDETRAFVELAFAQAHWTDAECSTWRKRCNRDGALGALVALYLAMRASEVINIRSRDVDDGGRLLWIDDGKSENAKRVIEIPEELQGLMLARAQAVRGRKDDRLFPRKRCFVRRNVKRLCRLVGVPQVTAHGVRGVHATLAAESGTTAHAVAKTLGHGGTAVTMRHYIKQGTVEKARRDRFRQLIGRANEGSEGEISPVAEKKSFGAEPGDDRADRGSEPRSSLETLASESVSKESRRSGLAPESDVSPRN